MTINKYYLEIKELNNYFVQVAVFNGCLQSVSFIEKKQLVGKTTIPMSLSREHSIDYSRDHSMVYSRDQEVISQFQNYFSKPQIKWDINFDWPKRTDFQYKVLNYLTTIPLASTMTYGQIAKELHTSPRAVGNACRCNPFPIIIPCHRVVAQNDLGGYDGDRNLQRDDISGRLAIKYYLLKHEQAI